MTRDGPHLAHRRQQDCNVLFLLSFPGRTRGLRADCLRVDSLRRVLFRVRAHHIRWSFVVDNCNRQKRYRSSLAFQFLKIRARSSCETKRDERIVLKQTSGYPFTVHLAATGILKAHSPKSFWKLVPNLSRYSQFWHSLHCFFSAFLLTTTKDQC